MNVIEGIKAAAKRLSAATVTVHDEVRRIRETITEKRTALTRAQRAPRPVNEIIAERIPVAVAEAGRVWLTRHGEGVIRGERALGSPAPGAPVLPWLPSEPLPWGALCAALPDLAAEILTGLVRAVPYEAGPPAAERPSLVATLERELAELESAEEAIIEQAAEAGVVIQHRPEVVQRRATEARKRELEAQAARDRAEREAAIEALHRERLGARRALRSPYLRQDR